MIEAEAAAKAVIEAATAKVEVMLVEARRYDNWARRANAAAETQVPTPLTPASVPAVEINVAAS